MYNVRALLLSKDLEPRSHEGAIRLLGLHFIKSGLMSKSTAQIISKLMKYREEADYNPVSMFTKEDFAALREEAETLATSIKKYLKEIKIH